MATRFSCQILVNGERKDRFVIDAHFTTLRGTRLIESAFYSQFGLVGPTGDHHELEVLEPSLQDHSHSKFIHIHAVPETGRRFVCYTDLIATLDVAEQILEMWCVGTAFTMYTGQDFGPVFGENPETFMGRMKAEHGITFELTKE